MYAETGLLFPYMQSSSLDNQQLEEYCKYHKTNASMSNLIQSSTISEYDLGGEGDLFKAPEPVIEEPVMGLDPVAAAILMMSCGEEVITMRGLRLADIESIQSEQLLSEVLYECEKDLMEKAAVETSLSEVPELKIPIVGADQSCIQENKLPSDLQLLKSISSGRLSSMECIPGAAMKPTFLDFPGMDFGTAYGMRRAFSEGDIQTLGIGNGNMSKIQSPLNWPSVVSSCTSEDRMEKLSRYRNKRTKRNFGRKIKYACRKALADSQPRVRGRFAKSEESDVSKRQ